MRNIKRIFTSPILRVLLLVVFIITTKDSNLILSCGLFAFIGSDPDVFNWDKFNILGLFNDSRGGDACGRVFGNTAQYGVETFKYYRDFAVATPIPTEKNTSNAILGHCRKASSGGTKDIYAQPIVLKKKDLNLKAIKDTHLKSIIKTMDDEDIIFSGIHNGTIDNYKELAPTYGIPTEEHNDSKVLLTALFYGNLDILSKYIGTAAIVWHNHVYNKTCVFKGSSKNYKDSYGTTEERPLYFGYTDSGFRNFYVSSMEKALIFIGITEPNMLDLKENMVFTFKEGYQVKSMEIDRSKCYQNETYYPSRATGYAYNNKNRHSSYDKFGKAYEKAYNEYEDSGVWQDILGDGGATCKQVELWNGTATKPAIKSRIPLVRHFDYDLNSVRIQAERTEEYNPFSKSVVYNKTRYWMNGGLMHGVYILNNWASVPGFNTMNNYALKVYYFVEGILMDGLPAYSKALDEHKGMMEVCTDDPLDSDVAEQSFTEDVAKYSRFPVASITKMRNYQDICSNMGFGGENRFHTGHVQPLFSNRRYITNKGDITMIEYVTGGVRTAVHTADDNSAAHDYIISCSRQDLVLTDSKVGYNLIFKEGFDNPLSPYQKLFFEGLSLEATFDEKLILVHYLRDFNPQLKAQCKICPSRNTNAANICMSCTNLRAEYFEFKKQLKDDDVY